VSAAGKAQPSLTAGGGAAGTEDSRSKIPDSKGGPDSFTPFQPSRRAGGQLRPNLSFPSVLPRQNMATLDGDKDFNSPRRSDWP